MADQTINVPQLLLIILLGGLAIRYFYFGAAAEGTGGSNVGRTSAHNVRAREADVETVQQMFPQVPRRSIMWDLQRNGGNVAATTERVLSGRGLETPDLITRYNLRDKIGSEQEFNEDGQRKGWSQNKGERQVLMQRRKEEMILAARRKMEAKVKAEGSLAKPGI
ncbi:putative Coupling of ubiquitin conjugation to ER degradation protein 1 [Glarea lozoyensis 74030]|uniref:Coupling of ubiquitin conjugation to ER degradation protein 1 n=1 Tax=Glarea lozoyensis (strain ATCC 74030 / MF5533) TaxID=1104152 RepID=H0EZS0_GLAL7|nr:putative Coupling of ubiquitin conjugation to ER degradation protein 1 [Glarea lozoyensis 74030]